MNKTTTTYDVDDLKEKSPELDDPTLYKKEERQNQRNAFIAGVFLILLGGLFTIGQITDFAFLGWMVLPLLSLIFIVWGVLTRQIGFLIPGGILAGIGLGTAVMPLSNTLNVDEGGLFLLSFAAGWALITLLSAIFTDETHWWPLIPGGIMAVIGVAVITNGALLNLLGLLAQGWPLILIGVGLFLIYQAQSAKSG
jgi:hypothetical protein